MNVLLSLAALCAGMIVSPVAFAQSGGYGPISDFMTMDVCTGGNGRIVAGVPGDGACRQHRDIAPGETPTYTLQNFPSPGSDCAAGPVSKINLPITRDGATRIVSSTVRQTPCGPAPAAADGDADTEQNGASIQWHDDAYGFIMGSYSPVSLSSFESDLCRQNRDSSERFFRGWVIGPATVPPLGASGFGVFGTKLQKGSASQNMGSCATRYSKALTTWFVDAFTYKSGRKLVSLVSSHYSRGAPDGQSPGEAMQMEQTFWTREYGLSRWEKWARADWTHPRSGIAAPDLAERLVAAGRCSAPIDTPVRFTPQMETGASRKRPGVHSRVITNPQTGETQTWYMTLCEDYTNTAALSNGDRMAGRIADLADEAYWK